MGKNTKRSIIGGDLNLPYAHWNSHAEKSRGTQVFLNRQVWENGHTPVVNSSTRGNALFDVYLVRPESAFTSRSNVQGISDHCGVLLEVEWGENCREHQVERLVPVYHNTNATGLQSFLRGKFTSWTSNGGYVKEIWKRFQEIVFESINHFVSHKILRNNPESEYYNMEMKWLKVKVRTVYKRKLGQRCQVDLKRLSRLFQGFRLSSSRSAAYEIGGLGRGFEGGCLGKGIPHRLYTKGKSRRPTIQGSQNNLRCAAREHFGPTTVSSVHK